MHTVLHDLREDGHALAIVPRLVGTAQVVKCFFRVGLRIEGLHRQAPMEPSPGQQFYRLT